MKYTEDQFKRVLECSITHDAVYWQFAKEKFIIENEPED